MRLAGKTRQYIQRPTLLGHAIFILGIVRESIAEQRIMKIFGQKEIDHFLISLHHSWYETDFVYDRYPWI